MRPIRRLYRPTESHTRGDRSCLVFLHIPKTAGQTLHFSLLRSYPQRERIHLNILDRPLAEEMERIPLEERSRARLLWGHLPYGVHEHMPRHCEYITVLREPIDRVTSVFKYILRNPNHVLHDRVVGSELGLDEYIESGIDEGQTENSQTRQLSGRQFGALDREALAEAKRNLEGFLVVGLTEYFEETFALLRRSLRLRIPFYVTSNVSPPFAVSERAVELIRERNELDLELYAFACELFFEEVRRQDRSFGFAVSMYRAMRPLSRAAGRRVDLFRRLSRTWVVRRLIR
ncbi:MAG: hypothetical protein ACREA0_00285 [bacterium]